MKWMFICSFVVYINFNFLSLKWICWKKLRRFITYLIISGDIEDEDEVLSWLTDENTLEIPGKIEEVNSRMLDKILEENDHVVVFFCKCQLFYNW